MASLFTKIIDDELSGRFVWKDNASVVLSAIVPMKPGHTLATPRVEVDSWTDLEPEGVQHLTKIAYTIGRALDRTDQPERWV